MRETVLLSPASSKISYVFITQDKHYVLFMSIRNSFRYLVRKNNIIFRLRQDFCKKIVVL